jgi:uncharacterized membrane protein YozB (DUF420 family)
MATAIARPVKRRADDIFFPALAVAIVAVVFIGFAQSYFLPGMVFAKLPNALVHIHGAIFMSWIFLLLLQNLLVAGRRVKLHMTLGVLGLIIPPLMAVLGVLTVFDSIRRNGTGIPAELILVGDCEELALFLCLIAWAMLKRRDAASHKRLMFLGTMAILGPAFNRWPFPDALRIPGTIAGLILMPLLIVAYDLWSRRKVHFTTWVGTAAILIQAFTLLPLSTLPIWTPIVVWIRKG